MSIHGKNALWEMRSLFGFDWIWGRYLLAELNALTLKRDTILLDIGCGRQPYRSILGPKVVAYYGLDLLRPEASPDLCGEATSLPFTNNSVDVCFSVWLLDDLAQPFNYFCEVARVLNAGGISIMVDIQSFPEHDAPSDYQRLTRFALQRYAHMAGLFPRTVRPLGGFWAQIGVQLNSFFLRGVSGYFPFPCRVLAPVVNLSFYLLDRVNPLPRGTFANYSIFEKKL